jgi:hypothetical protein
MHREAPRAVIRTYASASLDALPDALAALACAIAWKSPGAFGPDLLMLAAPLFFIELPLAVMLLFADVWRVPGEYLDARRKRHLILWPTVVIGLLCGAVFGAVGLIAVAWLGGRSLWKLWREGEDSAPPPGGRWLVISAHGRENERWFTRKRPPPGSLRPGTWAVPFRHEQLVPGITLFAWIGFVLLVGSGIEFPPGGATPAYAAAVGWTTTWIGAEVPAHIALAGGTVLFTARAFAHFDEAGEPDAPPPSVEDDEILREVIAKVEKRPPVRKRRAKRR